VRLHSFRFRFSNNLYVTWIGDGLCDLLPNRDGDMFVEAQGAHNVMSVMSRIRAGAVRVNVQHKGDDYDLRS
jgi:hypothetical protein